MDSSKEMNNSKEKFKAKVVFFFLQCKSFNKYFTFNSFVINSLCVFLHVTVEQLPTIITHTSGPIIALPFDQTVKVTCEARGNPPPE